MCCLHYPMLAFTLCAHISTYGIIACQELDSLEDPTKKEVADVRKKIELIDRELRPLKATWDKKVHTLALTYQAQYRHRSVNARVILMNAYVNVIVDE